jgi:hypothetical protein
VQSRRVTRISQMIPYLGTDGMLFIVKRANNFDCQKIHPWALGSSQSVIGFVQSAVLKEGNIGESGRKYSDVSNVSQGFNNTLYFIPDNVAKLLRLLLGFCLSTLAGAYAIACLRHGWFWRLVIGIICFVVGLRLASADSPAENIRVMPIIVSELKFRDVKRHIFGAHLVERADNAALEDRPEALNRIRVNSAIKTLIIDRQRRRHFARLGRRG